VKRWGPLLAAFLIGVLAVAACAESRVEPESGAAEGINKGDRALAFTLESLDGTEISLSDHRGNVVLINFWATWCGPCRAELPAFEQAYQSYRDQGFVILGVNEQEAPQVIEPFLAEMGVTYPILLDKQGQVMSEYRVLGMPTSLFVDRVGVIQMRHTGLLTAEQLETELSKLLSER
jgi:peroxiredoxin